LLYFSDERAAYTFRVTDVVHIVAEVIRRRKGVCYTTRLHGSWPVRATEREDEVAFPSSLSVALARDMSASRFTALLAFV
jgi:hypothetical protein